MINQFEKTKDGDCYFENIVSLDFQNVCFIHIKVKVK